MREVRTLSTAEVAAPMFDVASMAPVASDKTEEAPEIAVSVAPEMADDALSVMPEAEDSTALVASAAVDEADEAASVAVEDILPMSPPPETSCWMPVR